MPSSLLHSEPSLLPPEDRALSTLENDGSRRWLRPRLAKGRLWNARRIVAYALLAIYTLVPYLHLNGFPIVLLDVVRRRFHILGVTFLPTDTTLLALLLLIVGLSIFLATAVLGRVWCGWACPQTVYLEFVFRPIERLLCGTAGRGGKPKKVPAWRLVVLHAVYLVIAFHLAHTLLSYFIGIDQMNQYIWNSTPLQHPAAFIVVVLAVAWIMWDFAYWREQMCIIGCPYGRMQSVLLDRNSLIVSYDKKRGEPRGKQNKAIGSKSCATCDKCGKAKSEARSSSCKVMLPTLTQLTVRGDCIDCTMCVQVCPTGIDIRDGLQLECINCTQCVDACDGVMEKIGLPRGLIGYSSQATRAGERARWFRPRLVVYPALIAVLASLFFYLLLTRPAFDLTVLRGAGRPFNVLADGRIENTMRLKLVNRVEGRRSYAIGLEGLQDATVQSDVEISLDPLESTLQTVRIAVPPERFTSDHLDVRLRIRTDRGELQDRYVRLVGPIATVKKEAL